MAGLGWDLDAEPVKGRAVAVSAGACVVDWDRLVPLVFRAGQGSVVELWFNSSVAPATHRNASEGGALEAPTTCFWFNVPCRQSDSSSAPSVLAQMGGECAGGTLRKERGSNKHRFARRFEAS